MERYWGQLGRLLRRFHELMMPGPGNIAYLPEWQQMLGLLIMLTATWSIMALLSPRTGMGSWKHLSIFVGGGMLLFVVLQMVIYYIEKDIRGQ
jgi:hypothetical protein